MPFPAFPFPARLSSISSTPRSKTWVSSRAKNATNPSPPPPPSSSSPPSLYGNLSKAQNSPSPGDYNPYTSPSCSATSTLTPSDPDTHVRTLTCSYNLSLSAAEHARLIALPDDRARRARLEVLALNRANVTPVLTSGNDTSRNQTSDHEGDANILFDLVAPVNQEKQQQQQQSPPQRPPKYRPTSTRPSAESQSKQGSERPDTKAENDGTETKCGARRPSDEENALRPSGTLSRPFTLDFAPASAAAAAAAASGSNAIGEAGFVRTPRGALVENPFATRAKRARLQQLKQRRRDTTAGYGLPAPQQQQRSPPPNSSGRKADEAEEFEMTDLRIGRVEGGPPPSYHAASPGAGSATAAVAAARADVDVERGGGDSGGVVVKGRRRHGMVACWIVIMIITLLLGVSMAVMIWSRHGWPVCRKGAKYIKCPVDH